MATGPTVEERLARLERAVAELQRVVAVKITSADPEVAPRERVHAPAPSPRPEQAAPPPPRDWVAIGQLWIGRAGLAILVLGLVFLFHYAVVQGWLTPELRVTLGVLAGAVLLAAGLRLHAAHGANRAYGLLLLGGGVGVLYLSAYAAFGFYRLVSAGVALVALAALALLAVRLAANREEVLLAHVGAVGAFAAPVLVQAARPSVPLLVGYIVLVVAWTGWTAVREGWRLLAWTAAAGAALLLALGQSAAAARPDRVLLALGAVVSGVGLATGLLVRLRAGAAAGAGWKRRPAPGWLGESAEALDLWSAVTLAAAVAIFLPVFVAWVLHWPREAAGELVLAGAVLLGATAWDWRDDAGSARALALAAALPLLVGTALLHLSVYRGAFALEALAILIVGRRADAPRLTVLGHLEWAFVALTFVPHFAAAGHPVAAAVLVTDLAAPAAALYATRFLSAPVAIRIYAVGGLLALLGWLLLALLPLSGGQYWATIAWGALGTLLLFGSYRRLEAPLRAAALIVLAAVALKLLLVDTARLPAGGRVVVFLGFGALFLLLGPLYRRHRLGAHPPPDSGEPSAQAAPVPPGPDQPGS